MSRSGVCVALALLLTSTLPCLAATPAVYKVEINDGVKDGDMVGTALVYALKEGVRKSAGFSLDSSGAHFVISIATLDPDVGTAGANTHTIYSVVYVLYTADKQLLFLTHVIGVAGAARINEAAGIILAGLDKQVAQ